MFCLALLWVLAAFGLAAMDAANTYGVAGQALSDAVLRPGEISALLELPQPGRPLESIRYMLFMPKDWKREDVGAKTYPVILFMHGAGGVNNEPNIRGQSMGARLSDPPRAGRMPFIVVLPVTPSRGWQQMFPACMDLLDLVHAQLGGNPEQTYALGQSMGGNGAWMVGATYPERFAAVVPVCGHFDRDEGAVGQCDAITTGLKSKPVWVFHSADDSVVSVDYSDRAVQCLRDAGNVDLKYTRYETAPPCVLDSGRELPGHGSYELAFNDESLYAWLLEQRLGTARRIR
jgi:predicted peptidase